MWFGPSAPSSGPNNNAGTASFTSPDQRGSSTLPNASRSIRPAAKSAIKAGLALYETGRERVAELGEQTSDLIAEVRAEREEQLAGGQSAGNGHDEERTEAFTPSDDDVLATRSRKYDA